MATVEVPIRLFRHSLDQTWGFRLEGGNHGAPLTVSRVFAGGIADGQLCRGDVVTAIDNHDITSLQQAEQLVIQATSEVLLTVRRQAVHHSPQVAAPSSDYPFEFHGGLEDYDHAQNYNLVRDKFSHSEADYDTPVRGKVQINAKPGNVSYIPKKVVIGAKKPEFGWGPSNLSPTHSAEHLTHQPSAYQPTTHHSTTYTSHYRSPPVQQVYSERDQLSSFNQHNPIEHTAYEKPAWLGSLKSSSGLKPWEAHENNNVLASAPPHSFGHHDDSALKSVHQPKVQVTKFAPDSVLYEQRTQPYQSDTARIQHSQYNTPLGLYSAANASQVLDLQTADKPGSGTLKIVSHNTVTQPYKLQNSEVFKLLREEEGDRRSKRRDHNLSIHNPSNNHSSFYHPTPFYSNFSQQSSGISDF